MKKFLWLLATVLAPFTAFADNLGDFAPATTAICGQYTTYNPSTGAPFTLAGSPVLSVYKIGDGTNSATESTTGVTHAEDVDSRTGMNRVCVDTSADGTFYSAGGQFSVVITTGTVNSVSVVGSEVKNFSLNKVAALRPTTAGRTAVVDANGLVDANTVKLGPTGSGTAQTARDLGASVLLSAGTGTGQLDFTAGVLKGNITQWNGTNVATPDTAGYPKVTIKDGTGTGEIDTNAGAVVSVTTASSIGSGGINEASYATTAGSFWPLMIVDQGTAQSATSTTLVLRAADAFADSELVGSNVCITGGTTGVGQCRTITAYAGGSDTATVSTWTTTPTGTITYKVFGEPPGLGGSVSIAAGGITTSSFASGAINAAAIATDAIGAAQIAANAIGASEIATDAITSTKIANNALTDAKFDTTAGPFYAQGVVDQGTAQSVTGTSIQLRSAAAFADSELVGATVLITGGTTGVGQSRIINAYTGSTDTATVSNWTTTPTGTITYKVFGTAPGSSGSVTIAAGGISSSSFTTGAIDANAIATDAIGNSEIANGAISASKFASGAIDAAAIATDAIGSAEVAASAVTEIQTGLSVLDAAAVRTAVGLATANLDTQFSGLATTLGTINTATGAAAIRADVGLASANLDTQLAKQDTIISAVRLAAASSCSSGTTTTCVDAVRTEAATDYWKGASLVVLSGSTIGESRCVVAFNPASDTLTVKPAFTAALSTNQYMLVRDTNCVGVAP